MLAIDTNIVVRLIMGDDPGQAALVRALVAAGSVWVSRTVLLETNWVLESNYGLDESKIRDAFRSLLGRDNVVTEEKTSVAAALALAEQGVEFADALHLFSRPPGAEFVTFDRTFVRRAKRAGVQGISEAYLPR